MTKGRLRVIFRSKLCSRKYLKVNLKRVLKTYDISYVNTWDMQLSCKCYYSSMLGEIGVSCIRRGRVFRVIDNPLDYLDDEAIVRRYYNRLSSFLIHDLCVQSSTLKARAFPVSIQQVMVALRLYFRQMLAMYTTFQVQVLAR